MVDIVLIDISSISITAHNNHHDPHSFSAEQIALSLLERFTSNSLPTASELSWLVSKEDVPQEVGVITWFAS